MKKICKDLKKIKIETVDDIDVGGSDFEDEYVNGDVEAILNTSGESNETFEETERKKVISLSEEYRDYIPISMKESDDDIMALDYI